jgi:hypothetical protein
VKDLGNKSAYNENKEIYGQDYISYCSNDASLGDIENASSNFNCTYPTTTTTTTITVTTFDGRLVPTPKTEDTKELSATEIILIAVGGVVFSALVGFAIYKWSSVCRKSIGYTYVLQA